MCSSHLLAARETAATAGLAVHESDGVREEYQNLARHRPPHRRGSRADRVVRGRRARQRAPEVRGLVGRRRQVHRQSHNPESVQQIGRCRITAEGILHHLAQHHSGYGQLNFGELIVRSASLQAQGLCNQFVHHVGVSIGHPAFLPCPMRDRADHSAAASDGPTRIRC